MSMTLVAFLKKAETPKKNEIEKNIRELGYEFEILYDFENFNEIDGIECVINGQRTFFEVYFNNPNEITNDFDFVKKDLTDQDTAISFIWGADFAAGASIGLISIALIDKSDALIYYLDDEIAYSREMLLDDSSEFLKELEKGKMDLKQDNKGETKSFWGKIKEIFR